MDAMRRSRAIANNVVNLRASRLEGRFVSERVFTSAGALSRNGTIGSNGLRKTRDVVINGLQEAISLPIAIQEEATDEAVTQLGNNATLVGVARIAQSFAGIVVGDILVNSAFHQGYQVGNIDGSVNILEHGLLRASGKGLQFEPGFE